jgi:hypothetical protein
VVIVGVKSLSLSLSLSLWITLIDKVAPEAHIRMILSETGAVALRDGAGGFIEVRFDCCLVL